MKNYRIPCAILRGGTSRGLYILKNNLPEEKEERDAVLLRLMGSPDKKQIDGLGGATSVTSKVAIVSASDRPDADIDYTFAQVSVDKAVVSYSGNCGNISSGVGPFAIENGLVAARDGETRVRIYNTNTEKIIEATVCTEDGFVRYTGDYSIPGVPGTAAPVELNFIDPSGTLGKGLLPTGNPRDVLEAEGVGQVECSIVDAANPLVFIRAEAAGAEGILMPSAIDGDGELLSRLEKIRGAAAVKLGLIENAADSPWKTPGVPKLTIVSAPKDYTTVTGGTVKGEQIDLVSQMMSMQKAHPTYAMTGAICTAAAAVIPGTLVSEACRPGLNPARIRIGHPAGVMEAGVDFVIENGEVTVKSAKGFRTANYLMDGIARISL